MRGIVLFVGVLTLPFFASAAPETFDELVDLGLTYINAGIGIALMAGIVVFFFGVTSSLHETSSGKTSDKLHTQLLWGIIALFVMFSVWGILALLRNTLFGSGGYVIGGGNSLDAICAGSFDECVYGDFDDD